MSDFTESEYRTLCKAIAQGALTVEYGDKKVTYRSQKEMLELRDMMKQDLGLNGTNQNNGRRYATFSKGI